MGGQTDSEAVPFTRDQLRQIFSTNIIDFAVDNGFRVEKGDKATVHVKNSGGLYLFKHGRGYYSFTEEKGGNIVDFAMQYLALDELEAMELILGSRAYEYATHTVPQWEKAPRGSMELPPHDKDDRRVYAYLTKTRHIDPQIVQELLRQGKIYQSRQEKNGRPWVNCAFVGYDEAGTARYCALRGSSAGSSFRQDVNNSDKTYGFLMKGQSNRVYEFEAPIDAMSHATLCKLRGIDWRKDHRISEGCLSDKALRRFLGRHPEVNEIVICYDNDFDGRLADGEAHNHGQIRAEQAREYFSGQGYRVWIEPPTQKDYNKMLSVLYEPPVQAMDIQEEEAGPEPW